ncbi:hypothetical protein D9757_007413 [Collybiopsis confluens]|uniref:rRNA N-glycosylase n=1 Tax=Collybiopsis confluens TaxID=2823264 RepID=A0A8H5HIJ3_9AGAR|nr:hypothetical protein D9757_007413 [Collybiopsis confluens]
MADDLTRPFDAKKAQDKRGEYENLIKRLRTGLTASTETLHTFLGDDPDLIRAVPVLVPQTVDPSLTNLPPTFDLPLIAGDDSILLRIRRDNLYVIGYQRNAEGPWYELFDRPDREQEVTDRRLIRVNGANSIPLPFSSNYIGLVGYVEGMGSIEELQVGGSSMFTAVRDLAQIANPDTTNHQNRQKVARAILCLIVMIAEATRLNPIRQTVLDNWWTGARLGERGRLVNAWSNACNDVRACQPQPGASGSPVQRRPWNFPADRDYVTSLNRGVVMLGIMLALVPPSTLTRVKRSIANPMTTNLYPEGRRLFNIFSVVVNDIDGQNPGNLYGSINVIDNAGTQSIWTRTRTDYVSIRPKENIVLEGPSRPLYAANDLAIELDLWSHNPSDVQIANGWITFTPRGSATDYDILKTEEVKTAAGSVSVKYMAISDALHAEVEIILIDAPSQDINNLHGDIDVYVGESGKISFFHKVKGEGVDTETGDAITLSRGVIAVPTSEIMFIEASLYAQSFEIAKGVIEFEPSYNTSQHSSISGNRGRIMVRVSWL